MTTPFAREQRSEGNEGTSLVDISQRVAHALLSFPAIDFLHLPSWLGKFKTKLSPSTLKNFYVDEKNILYHYYHDMVDSLKKVGKEEMS